MHVRVLAYGRDAERRKHTSRDFSTSSILCVCREKSTVRARATAALARLTRSLF